MCVRELLYVPVAVVNDGDMKVRIQDVLVGWNRVRIFDP